MASTARLVTAFVGLGSNLGDRAGNIESAISILGQTPGVTVVRVARAIENPAVGGPADSPAFLNTVAEIQTTLGSHALLERLLEIERHIGRARRIKWEPRLIDLDILLYGDQIISSHDLVIPHPLMHERRFVLEPLAEIAPDAVHPVLQMTAKGLLDNLKAG